MLVLGEENLWLLEMDMAFNLKLFQCPRVAKLLQIGVHCWLFTSLQGIAKQTGGSDKVSRHHWKQGKSQVEHSAVEET